MPSGGKRPGAGRPELGKKKRVSLTVRLAPDVRKELARRAKEQGVSVSVIVERIVRATERVIGSDLKVTVDVEKIYVDECNRLLEKMNKESEK